MPSPHVGSPIDVLNSACFCVSLDADALARALDSELGQPGLAAMIRQRYPFLFAARPVFVAAEQLQRMAQVMLAVESVAPCRLIESRCWPRRRQSPGWAPEDR